MILSDIIEACGAVFLCSSAKYFSFKQSGVGAAGVKH